MFFWIYIFLELVLFFFTPYIKNYNKKRWDKNVYIIRGVPGVGKRYLVANLEEDNTQDYSVCDRNQYFVADGHFNFKGKEVSHAEQFSRIKFLNSIKSNINNIYIIGYFNKLWMYEEYKKIAKMNNYNIRVLEIPCLDNDHLSYFNSRSEYNPPINKSKKCFNNWENDFDAIYYESYIEKIPGDSLPQTNKIDLDKQLNDYNNRDENEDTNDGKVHNEESLIEYDHSLRYLDQKLFNSIFKREIDNKLSKYKRFDLREDRKYL